MKDNVINFLLKTNDLQKTSRYGDYPKFCESTAEHTFKVILIVDYLYKYFNLSLDYEKCIQLAIYHDFGEMDLEKDVDIKGNASKDIKNKKDIYEINKIQELSNYYSLIEKYYNEYKNKNTDEAKFVNACDKLEGMIHPLSIKEPIMNQELFATYADKAIKNFPIMLPIYKKVKEILKDCYKSWGYEWKKEYDDIFNIEKDDINKKTNKNNFVYFLIFTNFKL